MAKIVRCEIVDVLPTLPDIAPLDSGALGTANPDDLFLCALGFEPRCLTLPRALQEAGYKANRAVYLEYATNRDDNAANLPELETCLRAMSATVRPLEADSPDFPNRLRALLELVISGAASKPPGVTFDVSVAANRLLVRCVKILLEYDICARILYSEAAIYYPTKKEYEGNPARWQTDDVLGLERGVSDVVTSIDHPGHHLDPLPDCLILFPTFKAERSKTVISTVDPSLLTSPGKKVIWLLGVPHLEEDRWRLEAMRTINAIGEDTPRHEVSTFDYKETMRALESIYREVSERYKITLSPIGSKMQALGTALFCHMHPDVRIMFATPKEYNAVQYSEGCKARWKIDFGSLKELRCVLDKIGTLKVEE